MPELVRLLGDFRRRILRRMLAVAALVSAVSGGGLFLLEGEWLSRVCASLAAAEARGLAAPLADGGESDRRAALDAVLEAAAEPARGAFVLVRLVDRQGQPAGQATAAAFASALDRFEHCAGQHALVGADRCDRQLIDDTVYVRVRVPVARRDGGQVGGFEGVYRLSPATVRSIRADNVKLFALTIGAVVLTVLALYPLMARLQGRLVVEARGLLRANLDTLKLLGRAVAKRDYGTGTHNLRVTIYAVRLAEALGLDEPPIRALIKGALLHDVGKIAVPDSVLLKPGRLDEAEVAAMRGHVGHGLDIIAASHWLADAAPVVGGHHERIDGDGYPRGLAGPAVPLLARLFSVVDVFDALTRERPYKPPLPLDQALELLAQGRGRQFDAAVVDCFLAIAPDLWREFASLDDAAVERVADRLLSRYFHL